MAEKKKNKPGRPKNAPVMDTVVDEKSQERLDMEQVESQITVDALTKQ